MLWPAVYGLVLSSASATESCTQSMSAPVRISKSLPRVDLRTATISDCLQAHRPVEHPVSCVLSLDGQDRLLVVRAREAHQLTFSSVLDGLFDDVNLPANRRWARRAREAFSAYQFEDFSADRLSEPPTDADQLYLFDRLFLRFSFVHGASMEVNKRLALFSLREPDEGAAKVQSGSEPVRYFKGGTFKTGFVQVNWNVPKAGRPRRNAQTGAGRDWFERSAVRLREFGLPWGDQTYLVVHDAPKNAERDAYVFREVKQGADRHVEVIRHEMLSLVDTLFLGAAHLERAPGTASDFGLHDSNGERIWVPHQLFSPSLAFMGLGSAGPQNNQLSTLLRESNLKDVNAVYFRLDETAECAGMLVAIRRALNGKLYLSGWVPQRARTHRSWRSILSFPSEP